MFKLRRFFSRRVLCLCLWLTLVVVPLGIVLHQVIQPQPRWQVQAPQVRLGPLSLDGSRFVTFAPQPANGFPLHVWDTATGKKTGPFLAEVTNVIVQIPDVPDRYLAVQHGPDERIVLVGLKQGWEKTLPITGVPVAFSPMEQFLFVQEPKGGLDWRLVETATARHVEGVKCQHWYSFSPDDERLFYSKSVKVNEDREEHCIHIWDCRRRTETPVPGIHEPLTPAPDGRTFVAMKYDVPEPGAFTLTRVLWDWQTGKTRPLQPVDESNTSHFEFSPDSRLLVLKSGGRFGVGGEASLNFWDVPSARLLSKVKLPNALASGKFSPDGRIYVGLDVPINVLSAWDVQRGDKLWERTWPPERQTLFFHFHDQGRTLLLDDGQHHALDAATGETRWSARPSNDPLAPVVIVPPVPLNWALPPPSGRSSRKGRHTLTHDFVLRDPSRQAFWDRLCFWRTPPAVAPGFGIGHFRTKVVETTTGKEVAEVTFDYLQDALVSDDGRTLITVEVDPLAPTHVVISRWDMPLRAPWLWVYGPPAAALAVGLLAFRFYRPAPKAACV